ncbi:transmembrane protein 205-like [Halichondria panicea]|uniref:transmembrane protein 205-like n=1 Tax=Halichondria panicea TaxID=6063 RepID=UPI00312BA25F
MAAKFDLPFTQPSSIVAFLCTLIIVVFVSPIGQVGRLDALSTAVRLFHLFSFAAWLGVQIWVTFFAGFTMYQYMPRHMFGFIQSKLFPKYFLLGTILSSVTIVTFLIEHPFTDWDFTEKMQGYSLAVSLLMVIVNLVYLEPQTTKCTFSKHKFEKEINAGNAIGKLEKDKQEQLRKNPQYSALESKFIWLHSYASVANLVALAAQAVHLWYLSCKLTSI